jgi:hypothetical protein
MIVHLIIGAVAAAALFVLVQFVQKRDLVISWWQWILTVLGLLYAVFVLEVIAGFLGEGVPQAALVMGLMTGMVAVIWGVLLGRFVYSKR